MVGMYFQKLDVMWYDLKSTMNINLYLQFHFFNYEYHCGLSQKIANVVEVATAVPEDENIMWCDQMSCDATTAASFQSVLNILLWAFSFFFFFFWCVGLYIFMK